MQKNYFACHQNNSSHYSCKKFDNYFEADNYLLYSGNSRRSTSLTIGICKIFPDFFLPLYLRYRIVRSKIDFRLDFES